MRKLALAAAYAVVAAMLSFAYVRSSLHFAPQHLYDLVNLMILALIAATAAAIPLLYGGFKELFHLIFSSRRINWREVLVAALIHTFMLTLPLLLFLAVTSHPALQPLLANRTALPAFQERGAGGEGSAPALPTVGEEGGEEAATGVGGSSERVAQRSHSLMTAAAGLLAVTAVTAGASAYAAWRERRLRRVKGRGGRREREVEELLAATERAIEAIEAGRDPRGAIVAYFMMLCRLLEERGVEVGEEMTAREVAAAALRRFDKLDPKPLHRLVHLFEEARYSTHEVDAGMRDEALACFRDLRRRLAGEEAWVSSG